MDDLISRQAAIDELDKGAWGVEWDKTLAKTMIESLPSAQQDVPDINVGDMVSRQAAIDALKRKTFRLTFAEEQNCEGHVAWSADAVYSDVMEGALLELPSAQPEINCSEFPNNSDTISRQDAVSRRRLLSDLKELITAWENDPVMAEQIKGIEVAIGYVELIPSAQPEHWIPCSDP